MSSSNNTTKINEYEGIEISVGFLNGNLDSSDESFPFSCEDYADRLQAEVEREYPGAVVNVDWQDGYGVLPGPLQTMVERVDGEFLDDFGLEESVKYVVDRVKSDVCQKMWDESIEEME